MNANLAYAPYPPRLYLRKIKIIFDAMGFLDYFPSWIAKLLKSTASFPGLAGGVANTKMKCMKGKTLALMGTTITSLLAQIALPPGYGTRNAIHWPLSILGNIP